MKYIRLAGIFILALLASCSQNQQNTTETSAPPSYMGQPTPDMEPVLFAPGVVNTDAVELNGVFNHAMDEFFFTRIMDGSFIIHHSELSEGEWSAPSPIQMFPDNGIPSTAVDMTVTPDGTTMYFLGRFQEDTLTQASLDIYQSKKLDGQWQMATRVPEPVSTEYDELYPVAVADGSIYFISNRPGIGRRDVWRAQAKGDGSFEEPVSLGPAINSAGGSGDTYVSPDESILIYSTVRADSVYGMRVSFKKDGEWQEPIYLGETINTNATDFCPYMTPDGKYFFFSRRYSDPPGSGWEGVTGGDVLWIDANFLYNFRK